MSTEKKTAAPVEEQPQAVEPAKESQEEVKEGVALEDTALAGISDEIVVVHADGGLNLRTGPGFVYPVAELLENGALLAVLELPHGAEVPGWALVHTGQRTGWVDCRFIQELEEAKEE